MQSIGSLQQFLNNINTVKRLQKTLKYKHYKNLIMTIDDEKKMKKIKYKKSNKCWMCDKYLYAYEDNKGKDHDHVADKNRGYAYKNCYINLRLTKKISVMLHNVKGYGGHLIMQKIVSLM